MSAGKYETALDRNAANHQPLTPLLFLERAAQVYPNYPAVVHGSTQRDYESLRNRCVQLAHALSKRGIKRGDTVAAILPNIPEMLECHYGVPMAGCVLNAINTRPATCVRTATAAGVCPARAIFPVSLATSARAVHDGRTSSGCIGNSFATFSADSAVRTSISVANTRRTNFGSAAAATTTTASALR
jgi:acyl-CoA synthetase (AMP-forming)/AMP-acid ligase II